MISKFSVKKPYTIFVSVIMVIVLGIVSFINMTTDLLPSIDLPYAIVVTTYPGASPEKVEMAVTKPLEQVLATTGGVKNINSVSSENSSTIMLEFVDGINMDSAIIEMSGYIDMVKPQLDDMVQSPMIIKMNPDKLPVMVASVDLQGMDIKDISKYVQEEIIPEFERIDGVAAVGGTGLVEEQVKIHLNSDKINELDNKLLSSVDAKLAEGKSQLDNARAELEEGKNKLSSEGAKQIAELTDATLGMQDGKKQLEDALNNLPKTLEALKSQREDLTSKKALLEELIKWQEEQGLPVAEAEKEAIKQFDEGITAIDGAIKQIEEQQPGLEEKLLQIIDGQKALESGKLTLNLELSKASAALTTSELQLTQAEQEFEKAKEEAYKNAGIKNMLNEKTIGNILIAENFSMPAGYIKEGESNYLVKVGEKFNNIEELEELLLFDIDVDGIGKIKLKDIASIQYTDNSSELYAKINGNDGVLLSFQKQSTYSTAEVSKKINSKIEELTTKDSALNITPLQDQGVYIDLAVGSVLNNLVLGGVLAIIILFLFLKSIRPTIIIAISIPISLLFAIALMYFSGVTINIISLSGLALAVGMLVDNSIVVIENIYRLRTIGLDSNAAAIQGAKQVGGAIMASTLTTIGVFLPIVFIQGLSRQLFQDMGLTIAYSLLASLIIALTLVPTLSSTMLKNKVEKNHRLFDKFIALYEKLLKVSLRYKTIMLLSVLVLLILSAYLSVSMGATLMPTMDSTQISVTMEMEKGATTNELRDMSNKVIEKIASIQDVQTVGAMENGGQSMFGGGSSKTISMYVILSEDKKHSSIEVADMIKEKTKDLNCELKVSASTMDMSALGGSGVQIVIKGKDLNVLKKIASDVGDILRNTEGTIDVIDGLEDTDTEIVVTVDKSKAMESGLTVAQVYQEISTAISSENKATELSFANSDYPLILVKDKKDTLDRESLKNYVIKSNINGQEKEVKLAEIASITEEKGLSSIKHDNQTRAISVTAAIDSSHNIGNVSDEVNKRLEGYEIPEGYTIDLGGEKESLDSTFKDLIIMIALAILFIYLIMVAQFQSLLSPFIVLFTIPLAFTGGFLALFITRFELSMVSLLGFLVLSGIVVNNGIVFVDYVNQLIEGGMDKKTALLETGKARIRPILMTALTTILGLSTLALGLGMGADMVQPMAIVTIGGLTYATILTLFVVPAIYDLLHWSKK